MPPRPLEPLLRALLLQEAPLLGLLRALLLPEPRLLGPLLEGIAAAGAAIAGIAAAVGASG